MGKSNNFCIRCARLVVSANGLKITEQVIKNDPDLASQISSTTTDSKHTNYWHSNCRKVYYANRKKNKVYHTPNKR